MTRKAGSADLPLHGGHVPKWLADRMTRAGAVISEAIVHHYGGDELLRRLPHPFWFQSFGAVMGNGLAFLRHRDERCRRAETRSRAALGRARHPCVRRPQSPFAADPA